MSHICDIVLEINPKLDFFHRCLIVLVQYHIIPNLKLIGARYVTRYKNVRCLMCAYST